MNSNFILSYRYISEIPIWLQKIYFSHACFYSIEFILCDITTRIIIDSKMGRSHDFIFKSEQHYLLLLLTYS